MERPIKLGNTTKARLFYSDGEIVEYTDQTIAYQVWLAAPRGVKIAFRGKDDTRPVYSWDCVDRP